MSDQRIETQELDETALDAVAGGIDLSGSFSNLHLDVVPGPNGVPIVTGGHLGSATLTVGDISF
ncbi:hypothetical protein [Streptomyces odontomachi]|uniref:hypothetical protein n=1 Tax=Streptomyces odontomachi TaxID=2944940 RepID=UPI00210D62B8|nr:hypothetical protein [Streptomyces sp. ODS25]